MAENTGPNSIRSIQVDLNNDKGNDSNKKTALEVTASNNEEALTDLPLPAAVSESTARPSIWKRTRAFITRILGPPARFTIKMLRKTNLTMWIIFGLVLGIIVGNFAPKFSTDIKPLAEAFLRMISSLITPLIFSTLVVGVAGHGDDLKAIGRLALKSIIYFEVITTLALILGLIMVNIIKPGKGAHVNPNDEIPTTNTTITWYGELYKIIPKSFFQAASDNEVLQIVFCALMFAVALCRVPSRKNRRTMVSFLSSLSETMFKVTELVMNYAPIGIGCSIAATVGKNGLQVLISLGKLVGTLYGTLVIFIIIVFIPVMYIAKIPIKLFARAVAQPFIIAFTTASSESALPKAMENLEKIGIPKKITSFVIPTGYSFNLDGTTLYLSIAAIYCAQATNTSMPIGKQIVLMFTLMLTSKGVAAVPRASLVVLSAALSSFDIPSDALGLIMGVDAFMDMARTSINVMGNCLACCVVARWEGQFPPHGRWEGRWAGLDPRLRQNDEYIDEEEGDVGEWNDNNSNEIKEDVHSKTKTN